MTHMCEASVGCPSLLPWCSLSHSTPNQPYQGNTQCFFSSHYSSSHHFPWWAGRTPLPSSEATCSLFYSLFQGPWAWWQPHCDQASFKESVIILLTWSLKVTDLGDLGSSQASPISYALGNLSFHLEQWLTSSMLVNKTNMNKNIRHLEKSKWKYLRGVSCDKGIN